MMNRNYSIWINGLPGAGKTTIAHALKKSLESRNFKVKVLDGDVIRKTLSSDLGFSVAERTEHIRRVAEVNRLFLDEGYIVINAFIAPTSKIRELVRTVVGKDNVFEISLSTPLDVCIKRDPKGLYNLAKKGTIKNMTGIHEKFEPSTKANLIIDTSEKNVPACIEEINAALRCSIFDIKKEHR